MNQYDEKKKKKVSIIIPAYNEETGIKDTISDLKIFAKKNNWEILVVNDGSTDGTRDILREIKGINIIDHPYNKGYGSALKTGIKNVKTPLIVFFDADGQHNPQDVEKLLKKIGNFDMLIGQRGKNSHQQWIRKPGKWLLSKVANYLTGRKIPDINSGLRVVKREIIINLLHLLPSGFSLSTTLTIAFMNLDFNVGYFPIKVRKRIGKSTVRQLKDGTNILLLIIRLIVLFNPLKVFMPVGFVLFFIGCVYEILYGIILFPNGEKLIPGALFILLTSIVIIFIGLVVDQISEIRKHQFLDYEK
jgi:glycosyltransferase involved in cell wall biosynthesis